MSQKEKQIGVRVDEQLLTDFRDIVQHRHNGIRGPLGEAYERAMRLYVAHYFLTNSKEFNRIGENDDIDLDDGFYQRVENYIGAVEPDLEELYWEIDQKLVRGAQGSGFQQDRAIAEMVSSDSSAVETLLPTDTDQEDEDTTQRKTAASADPETLVAASVEEATEEQELVDLLVRVIGQDEDLVGKILDQLNEEKLAEGMVKKMSQSQEFEDLIEKTG